ncbi:S-adenosylmethionine mitochondrial carrier protein [Armadillidium nasatum]|uniref:S-adenosylmethionine mitochondrial carrier protein n=1 Tax=Armadillidium nasatum TaxID=96803 RepID=A0A5N5SM80_9CRUS|nr:S-adenosylmethionine mitochondrial carrier protein [Armadillidium nasatum]
MKEDQSQYIIYTLSGGAAGMAVDFTLYPLDTIKTRLQSEMGFRAAGGFHKIYRGLGPALLGSAPSAGAFFCFYEFCKKFVNSSIPESYEVLGHATAASVGESAACIVRVPTEIVKQRKQTSNHSLVFILRKCIQQEGILGIYRGYWSTLMREIPFSLLQYPLWEMFKKIWSIKVNRNVNSLESAFSGALAGGMAAAATTPLDVAKTRIMLADAGTKEAEGRIFVVLQKIYIQKGFKGLYSGVLPRTLWMSLGGAIYFGAYEFSVITFQNLKF